MDTTELHEQLCSFLDHMRKINASDLYLVAGHPPVFRVDEVSYPARVPLEVDDIASMSESLLLADQRENGHAEVEQTITFPWFDSRFRASLFSQRGSPAIVVRRLASLRSIDELGPQPELRQLALGREGLVLVAGGKRSGRTSTIAAMIDHRNESGPGHIVTIEDAIEVLHAHKQCIVTQRAVGVDTQSYAAALRAVPGLAPDLVYVDEIREAETMEALLGLADAGYACVSSVLAHGLSPAIERVLGLFPEERQSEIRARLARVLRGVIFQKLVPAGPDVRSAAFELLVNGPDTREMIRQGDLDMLARATEGARSGPVSERTAIPLRLAPDPYDR